MSKLQDQYIDIKLQEGSNKAFATYFFPCHSSEVGMEKLKFNGIIHAFYPKKFPQNSSIRVCFGFRSTPGDHQLRLDLVNATTRKRVIVNETKAPCSAFLKDCRIEGELIMPFSEPGVYVLEQYVDDTLCADAIILADDYQDPSFYSLTNDAIEKVEQDGGVYLVRNSEKDYSPASLPITPHHRPICAPGQKGGAEMLLNAPHYAPNTTQISPKTPHGMPQGGRRYHSR